MTSPIHIGLIDDHRALTDAMSSLLTQQDNFRVDGVAHDFSSGMNLIKENNCDVYIIDMNLGKEDSCELIREVHVNQKIPIVLSAYSDYGLVKKAVQSGARSYLSKSSAATNIIKAIHLTLDGKFYYDDIIQNTINAANGLDDKLELAKERAMISQLTKREKEIIRLISLEYTSEEIAKELHLSKNTVDGYRKNLISKLGVRGSVGLSKFRMKIT